jgi:hypothetical protein
MGYLNRLDEVLPEPIDRGALVHQVVADLLVEWMNYVPVAVEDLMCLIDEHPFATRNYVVAKLRKYREPDGGPDGVVNLPSTVIMPIGHLIEFFIMIKFPTRLGGYLKVVRMPTAKRYEREILEIFGDVYDERGHNDG